MVQSDNGSNCLRYDTLEEWERVNPVLEYGELVIVKDNGKLKLKAGDGETAFNDLGYVGE